MLNVNGQPVSFWPWLQSRMSAIGLGFLPGWALRCLVISAGVLLAIPVLALALVVLALFVAIILLVVVLKLVVWIITLPLRIFVGILRAGQGAGPAPTQDDGRRNVKVIERIDP